jgi:uncharacterized damage-inducible protein DinB
MITTIADFERLWSQEIEASQKVLKHITDTSLGFSVGADNRTIGRLAWHITTTIGEMMTRTGLTIAGPKHDEPVPASAKAIFTAFNDAAISLLEQVKSTWKDASLQEKDEMYGEQWTRSATLTALIMHQVHHRGQLTMLMRAAGLAVPGVFGPAREEWAAFGMIPPTV